MQIGPASTAIPPFSPQPTRANRPDFTVSNPNNADNEGGGAPVANINLTNQVEMDPPQEDFFWMSVQGFTAAMEEQDLTYYDLNGSGEINIDDLVELLQMIAKNNASDGGPAVSENQQSAPPSSGASPEITNGDTRTENTGPPKIDAPGADLSASAPGASIASTTPTPLTDQITAASPKDKLSELAERITKKLTAAGYDYKPPANLGEILDNLKLPDNQRGFLLDRINGLFQQHAGQTAQVDGSRISNLLLDRLQDAGFNQRPPSNINAFVNELQLPGAVQQSVLTNLSQHYPQGLGVNFVR